MLRNKKLISLVCCAFLANTLNANEIGTEYTLKDLLKIAVSNNSKIQLSKEQLNIKKQEVKKARAAYLPILSASADVGQYDIESGGITQDGTANSVALSANQLIYDFGKTKSNVSISKSNLDASKSDIITTRSSILLSVKQAYYDILNKSQQIKVSKEAIKLDELQLEQAIAYFKAGVRTQIDITNAKLKLSNSKLKLVQEEYDLKVAKSKLTSVLGKALDSDFKVKKEKKNILTLAKAVKFNQKSLDSLIEIALKNRAEITKQEALVNASKSNMTLVDSQYYPKLDMAASFSDKNSDDISSLDVEQKALLLNVKWDFFTGNTTKYDKRISRSQLKSNYEELKQQKLEIQEEVTTAYYNLKQTAESVRIGLLSLNLATKNLRLADERYKAGLNDLIELNDAKLEYTQSKSSLVDTYYSYLTNIANLEYSLGL